MARERDWDIIFADCFKYQPEGWAFWKKVAKTRLRPGMCGYFDEQGDWQPIVDITDKKAVKDAGYTYIQGISVAPDPGEERWPLRKSENMKRMENVVGANMQTPALPAGGGATIGFRREGQHGAIMVTKGNVVHHQATPAHLLYKWLVKNGRAVLNNTPNLKRGIWLVTKTYTADSRAVALLTGDERTVTLNVNAQALGQGDIQATTEWWSSEKSEAWNVQDMTAEGGLVLAMDGLWCEDHWYTSDIKPVTKRKKQKFLGGAGKAVSITPVVVDMKDGEDGVVEFVPEVKGTIPGVVVGPAPPQDDDDDDDDEDDEDEEDDEDDEDDEEA
ncbi:hypothetical protein LTR47_004175 [Exophiala xenobiotica]|nr:hypothetical protein LTR41_005874 [Exophiala xenobiotica]KAK5229890.1 hypothetical protein LTR72_001424 [Exophiala xenobiotica]KAK5234730.1 hypothetical protein LTR47_004175 [Exophiala xenobiotica]KAK5251721.1 hypothetical protein LTS06_003664 [Exophiala xenobiotica]KAK5295856.1 hypothetical protein LTR14_003486 [Exophiala xenobiotica]